MIFLEDFTFALKKVLIRVDFNVPLNDAGEVTDDTRIRAAIPTIKAILAKGGAVILMSHLGRPKSGPEPKFSLKHILPALEEALGQAVHFVADCVGELAEQAVDKLNASEVLLLENLRFYKEEEAGDRKFAENLAKLAEVYVNDAFGTAHRAHASTSIIAEFFPDAKMFGFLMRNEIEAIDKVLLNPSRPFTAVMGGAKVSSKISIIENVLNKVNHLIIGGGMTFTFIKALGGDCGASLVEEDKLDLALSILEKAKKMGVQIHLPVDAVIADSFSADASTQVADTKAIPASWMGLDIGPETIKLFQKVINESSTILWNGPMGVFEMTAFEKGTKAIGEAIANRTEQGAFSLVGGGDSVAAVNQYDLVNRVSYVSTGGGALLEYMEGIELPGVAAIRG